LSLEEQQKLTHIIFSFCHLRNNRLHVDNKTDTLRIRRLVQLKKKNPSLKVLLSLGGWGGCATCSDVFSTEKGRKEFASSIKELNIYFGTEGIDLDWEYPAIEGYPGHSYKPEDKQNFTALVRELRNTLGTKGEISFAAGGFQKFIDEAVEWEKVMPLIDRVNVMTYDLVNGYSTKTGHHTALFSTAQQKESADNAVNALLMRGIPANKIVIGAAFYGRVWESVVDINNGLYQAGKFKSAAGYNTFSENFTQQQGFVYHWDSVAKAPFLYNDEKRLFVTYDDQRSIKEKTNYVKEKGLNGIMFWELSHDLSKDGLLDAIDQVRRLN
jgi:chitinase